MTGCESEAQCACAVIHVVVAPRLFGLTLLLLHIVMVARHSDLQVGALRQVVPHLQCAHHLSVLSFRAAFVWQALAAEHTASTAGKLPAGVDVQAMLMPSSPVAETIQKYFDSMRASSS